MSAESRSELDPDQRSDIALVEAVKSGNYGAFEELVQRYHDKVYRLAYGMTKSDRDAEEVLQETFLNAFKNIGDFRGDSSPGSWIYRIAANAALMCLRRRRRKPLLSLDDLPVGAVMGGKQSIWPPGAWSLAPDRHLLNEELRGQLEGAVGQLPEKYRLVLLLRDVEGFPIPRLRAPRRYPTDGKSPIASFTALCARRLAGLFSNEGIINLDPI
ncbi:MAG: sigma-70 family RNA polymerase sigma factor [Myxococcota bacterium]